MKITVRALDIWRLEGERRIVVRSAEDYNKFNLVSLGTGEATTKPMDPKDIFDYLVYGKNPLYLKHRKDANILPIFVKELNLKEWFEQELPGFGNFPGIWVWAEEVTDPEIIKYHESIK